MKATIDNLPDLPPEAGECEFLNAVPQDGDWFCPGGEWGQVSGPDYFNRYLIARPVKPKRLGWETQVEGEYVRSWCKHYRCIRGNDAWMAWYSASQQPLGIAIDDGVLSLAEAKAACQRHADEQRRPTVEQPKPEPPAAEIAWPEGAIALVKDEDGEVLAMDASNTGYWGTSAYNGPDPFPPGQDWRKCFLVNPACK